MGLYQHAGVFNEKPVYRHFLQGMQAVCVLF